MICGFDRKTCIEYFAPDRKQQQVSTRHAIMLRYITETFPSKQMIPDVDKFMASGLQLIMCAHKGNNKCTHRSKYYAHAALYYWLYLTINRPHADLKVRCTGCVILFRV